MVAFADGDPIGVLIGAKRSAATLIHSIAVHPDHVRHGHGRHMLTSLSSKLAILGPPRIVAEVPESFATASALFDACGYVPDAVLTDYVLEGRPHDGTGEIADRFVIPVTVDDLVANGLLAEGDRQVCWERSVETLTARKEEITGLAVASDEQIEAYIHYIEAGEILALRSFVADDGARRKLLLSRIGAGRVRFAKVHPAEISAQPLASLGFEPTHSYRVYATTARPE
jgi:hypothetical protein